MRTYTPGLNGTRLLPRDVHTLIWKHGWQEPLNMCRMVATLQAESQFWTEAVGIVNSDGTQDFGLFQLNSGHWSKYATSLDEYVLKAFDPAQAAVIARQLWGEDRAAGGNGFRLWAAFTHGAYEAYLSTACRALTNFAAVQLVGEPIL